MLPLLSNLFEYFGRSRRPEWAPETMPIAVSAEGFAFSAASGDAFGIEWSGVDSIATWKYDMAVYDEIVLGFHRTGTDDWVVISEQQPGFMDVAEEMRRRFPTVPESWYFDVMQPTFETKLTLLYGAILPGRDAQ